MKTGKINLIRLLLTLGYLLLIGLAYFFLDDRITFWLYHHRNRIPDNEILKTFEMLGKGWLVIWLLLCWAWATGRIRPMLVSFLTLGIIAIMVFSVKVLVSRPRPYDIMEPSQTDYGRNDLIRSWSFPSGDTATVFGITMVFSSFVRRRWVVMLLMISTGIGLLRIMVLAHYLSDVLAGAGIGVCAGLLAIKINHHWQLLNRIPYDRLKNPALVSAVLLPLVSGFSESWGFMFSMLTTYGVLILIVFLTWKAGQLYKTRT